MDSSGRRAALESGSSASDLDTWSFKRLSNSFDVTELSTSPKANLSENYGIDYRHLAHPGQLACMVHSVVFKSQFRDLSIVLFHLYHSTS